MHHFQYYKKHDGSNMNKTAIEILRTVSLYNLYSSLGEKL